MYGKVIGTSISVDCFHEVTKDGIYFLTEGQLDNPLPNHVDRVYTSLYNARVLQTRFEVNPDKIVSLPINEKLLIQDKIKRLNFYVTLIDAKQKPGAVMFLFEGDIGNILYAGKCCYGDSGFSQPLQSFLKVKKLDCLYVHSACPDCDSHSLSATAAVDEIVNIVRWNPNCKVVISDPCLREDLLSDLKIRLRMQICVSENLMKHLEEVGRGADFTLDHTKAQVIVTDRLHYRRKLNKKQPIFKIVLIPCSMKRTSQEIQEKQYKLEKKGYNVILYRNHCSPSELVALVKDIDARHSVLVRPGLPQQPFTQRRKDLVFWSHLGDFHQIVQFSDSIVDETLQLEMANEDGFEVSNELLQKAVESILADNSNHNEEVDRTGTPNRIHGSEASPPSSFILIDSDKESILSNDVVLNGK
uniref:DNA repair metallo-beta-lactamase domain-containing protein n=1 Tax=Graphocephala atropunctata TaxID=36148 RepID=A0A1B6L4B3_9HEMI